MSDEFIDPLVRPAEWGAWSAKMLRAGGSSRAGARSADVAAG
jgi:hypothetical protein